jgi:hypothetical protein
MEQLRPNDDINKGGVKFDDGKNRLDLLPHEFIFGVGQVLTHGAKKYAARNWELGMDWSRPFGGAMRHLWKWWSGERLDPDSGLPHLWHAACNLAFLCAYEERRVGNDDRPKKPVQITISNGTAASTIEHGFSPGPITWSHSQDFTTPYVDPLCTHTYTDGRSLTHGHPGITRK